MKIIIVIIVILAIMWPVDRMFWAPDGNRFDRTWVSFGPYYVRVDASRQWCRARLPWPVMALEVWRWKNALMETWEQTRGPV